MNEYHDISITFGTERMFFYGMKYFTDSAMQSSPNGRPLNITSLIHILIRSGLFIAGLALILD